MPKTTIDFKDGTRRVFPENEAQSVEFQHGVVAITDQYKAVVYIPLDLIKEVRTAAQPNWRSW